MNRSLEVTLMLLISIVLMTSTSIADNQEEGNAGNVIDDISNEFFFDYNNYNKEILDIQPYKGPIRPSHAMYELRVSFWNIDETFTNDETDRLDKQMWAARQFIAETITEVNEGDEENADIALRYYRNKIEDIDHTLAGSNLNSLDLTYANKMNQKNCDAIYKLVTLSGNQTMNQTMNQTANRLGNLLGNSLQLGYNYNWSYQYRNDSLQPEYNYNWTHNWSYQYGNDTAQSNIGLNSNGQDSSGQMGSGQDSSGQVKSKK